MVLACGTLSAENDPQVLLLYAVTPGTESADPLRLLQVVGSQTFDEHPTG